MNTKYEAKYFSPIPALVCDLVFTRTVELVHLLIFPFVPVQLKGWPERIGSIKNVSLETRIYISDQLWLNYESGLLLVFCC